MADPVPLATLRTALDRRARQAPTLRHLAQELGVSYGTLQPFLAGTGRHPLTAATRYRLRKALGLLTLGEQIVEAFTAGASPPAIARQHGLALEDVYHALRQTLRGTMHNGEWRMENENSE